jgi:hypothetical protein
VQEQVVSGYLGYHAMLTNGSLMSAFRCHVTEFWQKRWLHAEAMQPKCLRAYIDEFAFRHNRRKTNGLAGELKGCGALAPENRWA